MPIEGGKILVEAFTTIRLLWQKFSSREKLWLRSREMSILLGIWPESLQRGRELNWVDGMDVDHQLPMTWKGHFYATAEITELQTDFWSFEVSRRYEDPWFSQRAARQLSVIDPRRIRDSSGHILYTLEQNNLGDAV